MLSCECDNCTRIIHFNTGVMRNGDIYCSECSHLYEHQEQVESMEELTWFEERADGK